MKKFAFTTMTMTNDHHNNYHDISLQVDFQSKCNVMTTIITNIMKIFLKAVHNLDTITITTEFRKNRSGFYEYVTA